MVKHQETGYCYCGACVVKRMLDNAEESIHGETQRAARDRTSGRRSGPPLAKNPANQAAVTRLWEEEQAEKARKRAEKRGKETYGRGSQSGSYGNSSYSRMKGGTFDGYPSLSRRRDDGATDIFYGPEPIDPDDATHGHAVIKNGKLVYKRRPGESNPVVNKL